MIDTDRRIKNYRLVCIDGAPITVDLAVGSSSKSSLSADWVVSVQNLELMSDPHCEQGSQDAFVIDAAHSLVPLQDITALRSTELLILRGAILPIYHKVS